MKKNCFKGCFHSKGAFTLIELLVVVLIIGILAAVAVPQYQVAVAKSRYATLKHLAKSLVEAQEVYYLANGMYATEIEKLDIDLPGDKLDTSTSSRYNYPWGYCRLQADRVICYNSSIKAQYQQTYEHSDLHERVCLVFSKDEGDTRNRLCKNETRQAAGSGSTTDNYKYYVYP